MKKIRYFLVLAISMLTMFIVNYDCVVAEEISMYEGKLGYIYTENQTIFKVIANNANKITVVVDGIENGSKDLVLDENNVWIGYIAGDLNAKEYSITLEDKNGNIYNNLLDPYGKYINSDKTRNVIYDDNVAILEEFDSITEPLFVKDNNKIIYGLNVTNFTKHSSWKGNEETRGKLLGLVQSDTSSYLSGFDHIKSLGVTYVEFTNIIDSYNPYSIDNKYVSGTAPYSGNIELKSVVNEYYLNNIGIIMTFDYKKLSSEFIEMLKMYDDEAYLNEEGNLDLEKPMTQKYILDLLSYYVETYKLSGIKIVNMNEYSVKFINYITSSLKSINEQIIIYGNGNYEVEKEDLAGENNLDKLEYAKMINGSFNFSMFGKLDDRETKGILDGNYDKEIIESLKFTLLSSVDNGQIDYSLVQGVSYKNYWGNKNSFQIINQLGTSQGLSIYDKLIINNLSSENIVKQKVVLAFGTMMMSGGIPYIQAGEEFLSSYLDLNNQQTSICSENNAFCFHVDENLKVIDWSFVKRNEDVVNSFKSLVNYRKSNSSVAQMVAANTKNLVEIYENEQYKGVIGFTRKYTNVSVRGTEKIFVVFNYSNNDYILESMGKKGWNGLYNYNASNRDGEKINLKANSLYIEYKQKQSKMNPWVTLIFLVGVIGGLYYANIILNRKLVEQKGYDIKDIKKKYRPFIRKNKMKANKPEENIEKDESESQESNDNNEE